MEGDKGKKWFSSLEEYVWKIGRLGKVKASLEGKFCQLHWIKYTYIYIYISTVYTYTHSL